MWYGSLCLIGVLIAVANGQISTTSASQLEHDREITHKFLNILKTMGHGQSTENHELTQWIETVRDASKWGPNRLTSKVKVEKGFRAYNRRRLELEEDIEERLDELTDELIPSQEPNSKCSKFYKRQRNALRRANKLTNTRKMQEIIENSVKCPHKDTNGDSDEDRMLSDATDSRSLEV